MTQQRFHTIATHHHPHPDEIVAWMILQWFGEEQFPGVRDARLAFYDVGRQTPDGRPVEAWVADGVFPLGIWGWWTDKHPSNGEQRDGTCCATRVAERLGIHDHPALRQILRWVEVNDTQGTKGGPLDLAMILRSLYEQHPDNPEVAIQWITTAIRAKYLEQSRFFSTAKEEFVQHASVEEIPRAKGKALRMAVITSDDDQVARYARASHGSNCDVVVQRRSTGHVVILTRHDPQGRGVKLADVARMLRQQEIILRDGACHLRWDLLESDGTLDELPEWHYQEPAQNVLNGGRRASVIAPTRIPLSWIRDAVRIALTDGFEPSRHEQCRQERCTSHPGNQCSWYDFGLRRCRWVRAQQHKARQQQAAAKESTPPSAPTPVGPSVEVKPEVLGRLFGGSARVR